MYNEAGTKMNSSYYMIPKVPSSKTNISRIRTKFIQEREGRKATSQSFSKRREGMITAEDYSINRSTIAFQSIFSDYGEHHTIVYEQQREIYVKKSPLAILEENILLLGTTYDGIIRATRYFLPGQKMLCILFSALDRICFFHTTSISRDDNLLLVYSHVIKIEPSGKGSVLTFSNGKRIYVPVFHRILINRRSHASYVADTIANNYKTIQKEYTSPIYTENNDGNIDENYIQ